MNFLAHFHLSDGDEQLLTGAMMGDFIKGPVPDDLPVMLGASVRLHRRIDRFADAHPLFRASSRLFRQEWGLYGAVLVDVLYDHLLAAAWDAYSTELLSDFAARVYRACALNRHLMPPRMVPAVDSMIRYDWLGSYGQPAGIRRVLTRISAIMEQRTGENPQLVEAWPVFEAHRDGFHAHFNGFYRELQDFTVGQRRELGIDP